MSAEAVSPPVYVSPLEKPFLCRRTAGIHRVEAGIDTFSLCFASPQAALDLHKLAAAHDSTRGPGAEGVKLRRKGLTVTSLASPVSGISVGGYYSKKQPEQGIVWVEGRLAAFLADDPSVSSLAPVTALAAAEMKARALFVESLGIGLGPQLDGPAGLESHEWLGADNPALVRRCDLTVDLYMDTPEHGFELLKGFSMVSPKGLQREVFFAPEVVQGVYHRRERRVDLRIYDKARERRVRGVDAGAPGTWVRVERQLRFRGANRQTVTDFAARADLGVQWAGALGAWACTPRSTYDLVAVPDGQQRIIQHMRDGTINAARGERLLGTLAVFTSGTSELVWTDRTRRSRRADLLAAGVVPDLAHGTGSTVPLGEVIHALIASWPHAQHAGSMSRSSVTVAPDRAEDPGFWDAFLADLEPDDPEGWGDFLDAHTRQVRPA